MELELAAVVGRVQGVEFVQEVLLAAGDGIARQAVPMTAELPRLLGLSVTAGAAVPLINCAEQLDGRRNLAAGPQGRADSCDPGGLPINMDVNGTRYYTMLGRADFADALANPNLAWDDARQELILARLVFNFPTSPLNRKPTQDDDRGAAADQYGNIYSIADSGTEIVVRNSGTGTTTHFWSAGDLRPAAPSSGSFTAISPAPDPDVLTFSGIAVTCAHYLVAGVLELKGLLVFNLHHGGPAIRGRPRAFVPGISPHRLTVDFGSSTVRIGHYGRRTATSISFRSTPASALFRHPHPSSVHSWRPRPCRFR